MHEVFQEREKPFCYGINWNYVELRQVEQVVKEELGNLREADSQDGHVGDDLQTVDHAPHLAERGPHQQVGRHGGS